MSELEVTVIVLGYNGLDYIDGCLGSLLDQDFPAQRYEVIWADNCSRDGSAEYVSYHFPEVRVLRFNKNHGFAEGNNRAAKEAQGRYLAFLNQDTIVHRNWLSALVEAMEAHSDLGACQANMLMPWSSGFEKFERNHYPDTVYFTEVSRYGFVEYQERPMQEDIIPTVFVTGAAFIVRKSIVDRMPYIFPPHFVTYSEDLDLSLRLNRLGYRAGVAPRAIVYHRQDAHVSSFSTVRKAYLATRNRMLAYYGTMSGQRFLGKLPLLVLGSPLKALSLRLDRVRQIVAVVVLIPISMLALLGAIWMMPRHSRTPNEKGLTLPLEHGL